MTVEVWYGSPPHGEPEQKTLVRLYQYLRSQPQHFVVLHNFFAGQSNEIDLVVLKENGIFLAELKHVWNPISGEREGPWVAHRPDGTEIPLNPGRPNPFKQTQANYYAWRNWVRANAERIRAGLKGRESTDWEDVMCYIVLYPDIPEGSQIGIGDHPIQVVGLSAFLFALITCSSPKLRLSLPEMGRIPQLLKLTQWPSPTGQMELPPEPLTKPLQDWQPPPFAVLVARGHTSSVPVLDLLALGKEAITVGRAPDNDLMINEPTVSRHHARIYRRQGRWVVRDLNSTSGTFVSYQGEPEKEFQVREGMEFALKNNSIVRFGPAAFTLLLHEEEGRT